MFLIRLMPSFRTQPVIAETRDPTAGEERLYPSRDTGAEGTLRMRSVRTGQREQHAQEMMLTSKTEGVPDSTMSGDKPFLDRRIICAR